MLIMMVRFASLVLTALTMGLSFTHVLEVPAKRRYDASFYLRVQQTLYRWLGPPSPLAFVEPASVAAAGGLS